MSLHPGQSLEAPLRVLLLEDDEGDALIVEDLLLDAPVAVELLRARSLAEARTLAAQADCALVDLDLPDAAGLEALRAMREEAPELATIVLTGLADEARGVDAVGAGAQDYLVKGQVDGPLLARSLRYAVERRRAEHGRRELEAARLEARESARLERGLLPVPLVSDPGLQLAAAYRPGRLRTLLGGDFYDAVQTPDGAVHALIGDVAGHGPDEAATGVALRIAWRTLVLSGSDAEAWLPTMQAVLVAERQHDEIFTTLCTASIAPDRTHAVLRVAGHPPPLLLGPDGGPVTGVAPGLPLGVAPGATWAPARLELPADWGLLLYTDGLVEGRAGGEHHQRLGGDWLAAEAARRTAPRDWRDRAPALVQDLIAAAERANGGPLADDVAVLLVTCGALG
ncbi:MAG TPA: fused response regulator/phosphatase [Baekduia sp.]|nr:fused response regulator/phosphatase [Baekduia sp.]